MTFSFQKFINKKANGGNIGIPAEMLKAIKSWDGYKVHKFNSNNVRRKIFGEVYYILIGDEKISIGKEFCDE